MSFAANRVPDDSDDAHALRRYVSALAHGRPFPTYSRYDVSIGAWVAADEVEVAGLCDGRRFRQVRRPGLPWCIWLGPATRIAGDHALQAFFELHASEPHDWQRLLKEVTRNRRAALRDWRLQGLAAIDRLRRQGAAGKNVALPSPLSDEFRKPGMGMRSLRKT